MPVSITHFLVAAGIVATAVAQSPVELANPLVGTASLDPEFIGNAPPPGEEAYTGFTHPGPGLPHRWVQVGPINKVLEETAGNHGIRSSYIHSRRTMLGFSSPMPGLTIMPVVGAWNVPPDRSYASPWNKETETASPGYYSVEFPDTGVRTELTATEGTGYYRFTFPKSKRSTVLIDLGGRGGEVEIVGDRTVRGRAGRRSFVAEFSRPFDGFGVFRQNPPHLDGGLVRRDDFIEAGRRDVSGDYAGAYLEFSTSEGEQVLVRIAAGRDVEAAEETLKADPQTFAEAHQAAEDIWAEKLGLIEVEGGTEKQRRLFYSTLYHSLLTPRLIVKKGEPVRRRGAEGEVVAPHDIYTPIALWDTGRNQVVLLTLLEPEVKADILKSHLAMAQREKREDLPDDEKSSRHAGTPRFRPIRLIGKQPEALKTDARDEIREEVHLSLTAAGMNRPFEKQRRDDVENRGRRRQQKQSFARHAAPLRNSFNRTRSSVTDHWPRTFGRSIQP